MRSSSLFALAGTMLPAVIAQSLPLSTTNRWIVDADGARVKMRCINWAGHMETNMPEGLNKQSVDDIADIIQQQGFNCVRLTYSIDHALSPDTLISDSFTAAAEPANVTVEDLTNVYNQVVEKNEFAANGTNRDAYEAVISALWSKGIMTLLDNHVSKASWCCNIDDGNGWWDEAEGYNDMNSRYFKTQEWLDGIESMASWAATQEGVVAMSLRNEIREWLTQGIIDDREAWYDYVTQGAERVHGANPDVLIVVGGTQSSTDLTHLRTNKQLDFSSWAGKHVWEWHCYSFTVTFAINPGENCDTAKNEYGLFDGFVLSQNESYTAPLIMSEFGLNNEDPSDEQSYFDCLIDYAAGNDMEWAMWGLMGSYYVRDSTIGYNDSFGILDSEWATIKNPDIFTSMEPIFKVTQGP